jgi:hypothetical protein
LEVQKKSLELKETRRLYEMYDEDREELMNDERVTTAHISDAIDKALDAKVPGNTVKAVITVDDNGKVTTDPETGFGTWQQPYPEGIKVYYLGSISDSDISDLSDEDLATKYLDAGTEHPDFHIPVPADGIYWREDHYKCPANYKYHLVTLTDDEEWENIKETAGELMYADIVGIEN